MLSFFLKRKTQVIFFFLLQFVLQGPSFRPIPRSRSHGATSLLQFVLHGPTFTYPEIQIQMEPLLWPVCITRANFNTVGITNFLYCALFKESAHLKKQHKRDIRNGAEGCFQMGFLFQGGVVRRNFRQG